MYASLSECVSMKETKDNDRHNINSSKAHPNNADREVTHDKSFVITSKLKNMEVAQEQVPLFLLNYSL